MDLIQKNPAESVALSFALLIILILVINKFCVPQNLNKKAPK